MSFTISVSGHDADPDDVKELFENLVRAARMISDDQASVNGYCSNSSTTGRSFSMNASEIVDLEASDANGDGDSETSG